MGNKLKGKKIAFLATDGVEEIELSRPWKDIKNAGAEVELISLERGEIQGFNHNEKAQTFSVDKTVDEVSAMSYDGLVLPGGVQNPDTLRMNKRAVEFVKEFFEHNKPVSAICHGPWLLVEAGVVERRKITSWPSLQTDIINAGGYWFDEEVVVDDGLITSRKPDDLDAFCKETIEEFSKDIKSHTVAA
ncbi:MAG: type 1 glutamine amidotransferase [Alphaproteobacteria bacterium]|nr:type 1 glutamine amidotransferase [Alphaproteobacteria bacterium]